MIATVMLYTTAVGFLLYAAAMGLEYVGRALGVPTRFIWLFAMTAAVTLSGSALWRDRAGSRHVPAAVSGPRSNQANAATRLDGGSIGMSAAIETFMARLRTVEHSVDGVAARIDPTSFDRWNRPLLIAWLMSSILVIAWLFVSLVRLMRLVRELVPGTAANRAVLVSNDVGPALYGMLRARIVLPGWVLELPKGAQEIVVAHEEQHAAAFDPAVVWASLCLVALQPWNAALWILLMRLRLAVEADCDRRVLRTTGDSHVYGELLVAMYARTCARSALVAFAGASNLERRIRRMTSRPRVVSAAVGLSALAAVVSLTAAWKTPAPTRTSATTPFAAALARQEPRIAPPDVPVFEPSIVTFRQIVIATTDSNDIPRAARDADSVATWLRDGIRFDSLANKYHDYPGHEATSVLTPWPIDSLPLAYQKAFTDAHAGSIVSFSVPGSRRPEIPKFVVAELLSVRRFQMHLRVP